jgi:ribosome-binding protein aMBF1 (putative translation factor)
MLNDYVTPEEYLVELGKEVKRLRKLRGLKSQADLQKTANVALNVVRNIENGKNTETLSLIRVLDALNWIQTINNESSVDPVAMLKKSSRGRKSKL